MAPISDIILKTPVPSRTAVTIATQQTYVDAMIEVANARALPLIDGWRRWSPASPATAFYDDTVHPNSLGYADIAEMTLHGLELAA